MITIVNNAEIAVYTIKILGGQTVTKVYVSEPNGGNLKAAYSIYENVVFYSIIIGSDTIRLNFEFLERVERRVCKSLLRSLGIKKSLNSIKKECGYSQYDYFSIMPDRLTIKNSD